MASAYFSVRDTTVLRDYSPQFTLVIVLTGSYVEQEYQRVEQSVSRKRRMHHMHLPMFQQPNHKSATENFKQQDRYYETVFRAYTPSLKISEVQ